MSAAVEIDVRRLPRRSLHEPLATALVSVPLRLTDAARRSVEYRWVIQFGALTAGDDYRNGRKCKRE